MSLEYYVTGLSLGDTRWVRVRAVTDVGNSPWAKASGKALGTLGAVIGLRIYPGDTNTKIMAEWKAPKYDGSPSVPGPSASATVNDIVRYDIQAKPYRSDGSGDWSTANVTPSVVTAGAMQSTVTVSGPGVITWIRVRAVNALYHGPWTEYIGISMNP